MNTLATEERMRYFHAPSNAPCPSRSVTRMKAATEVTSMNTYRVNRSRTIAIPLIPRREIKRRLPNVNRVRGVFSVA